jgi:hypothetical protein
MEKVAPWFILRRWSCSGQFPPGCDEVHPERAGSPQAKPTEIRAQLACGGCGRPISMPCESIAVASFGCGSAK